MGTPFTNFGPTDNHGPARQFFAITPSDSALLSHVTRAIYIDADGTQGTITFVGADGNADTWVVNPGCGYPIVTNQVLSTGTTATGIHGMN